LANYLLFFANTLTWSQEAKSKAEYFVLLKKGKDNQSDKDSSTRQSSSMLDGKSNYVTKKGEKEDHYKVPKVQISFFTTDY
jgi:hypothetical protein